MTDQQQSENPPPDEPEFSAAEVQNAFAESYGLTVGPLTFQCLKLRKLSVALHNHIAQLEADRGELGRQVSQLTAGEVSYEDRIHELEKELAARPTTEQVAGLEAKIDQLIEAGPTVAQTAGLEMDRAEAGRIKEAAPKDG